MESSVYLEKNIKNRMGLSIPDMFKDFLAHSGKLDYEEHEMFWKQVVGNEYAYFELLLSKALEMGSDSFHSHLLGPITYTMLYLMITNDLCFFKASVRENLELLFSKSKTEIGSFSHHILQELKKGINLKENFGDFLKSYLSPPPDKLQSPALLSCIPALNSEKCLYHLFLHNCLRDSQKAFSEAFDVVCEELKNLPDLLSNPKKELFCYEKALICLNFAHNLFSIPGREIEPEKIRLLLAVLEPFFFWPKKISLSALRLIKTARCELNFRGSGLLEKLSDESRWPIVEINLSELKSTKPMRMKPIYYISSESDRTNLFANMMSLVNLSEIDSLNTVKLKKSVSSKTIFLSLIYAIERNKRITKNDLLNLNWLSKKQIYTVFEEILNICCLCANSKKEFNSVQKEKDKLIDNLLKTVYKTGLENLIHSSNDLKPIKPFPKFPPKFVPEPAPKCHILLQNSFEIPSDKEKTNFEILVEKYDIDNDKSPSIINIVLMGKKFVIWKAVEQYIKLKKINVEFNFYLIPFEQSPLIDYIIKNDLYFKNNIYLPFVQNNILPFMNCDTFRSLNKDTSNEIIAPGLFLRNLVEFYVEEAKEVLSVCIFKADIIWSENESESDDISNEIVHFIESISFENHENGGEFDVRMTLFKANGTEGAECNHSLQSFGRINVWNVRVLRDGDDSLKSVLPGENALLLEICGELETFVYRVTKCEIECKNKSGFNIVEPFFKKNVMKASIEVCKDKNGLDLMFPVKTFNTPLY